MKLYKVKINTYDSVTSMNYGYAYVVANNTDEAYEIYRDFLDRHDLCHSGGRALRYIEPLAGESPYNECHRLLFIKPKDD